MKYFFLFLLYISLLSSSPVEGVNMKKISAGKEIQNPCMGKGLKNEKKNMVGVGDYDKCGTAITKIIDKEENKPQLIVNKKHGFTVVTLDSSFQLVNDYYLGIKGKEQINGNVFEEETKTGFTGTYDEFIKNNEITSKYDTISMKLVQAIAMINHDGKKESVDDVIINFVISMNFIKDRYIMNELGCLWNLVYSTCLGVLIMAYFSMFFFKNTLHKRALRYISNTLCDDNLMTLTLSPPVKKAFIEEYYPEGKKEMQSSTNNYNKYFEIFQRHYIENNKDNNLYKVLEQTNSRIIDIKAELALRSISGIILKVCGIISIFFIFNIQDTVTAHHSPPLSLFFTILSTSLLSFILLLLVTKTISTMSGILEYNTLNTSIPSSTSVKYLAGCKDDDSLALI